MTGKECKTIRRAALLAAWLLGVSGVWASQETLCPQCAGRLRVSEAGADLVVANTAPVTEPDWEELLKRRVREAQQLGLFREAERKRLQELRTHAQHPVDLELPRAQVDREFTLELVPEENLRRLAEPVQEVLTTLVREYVFFDAGDAASLAFVRQLTQKNANLRPVATAGDVVQASKAIGVYVFADQGAVLTKRLKLKAVPSLVRVAFEKGRIQARVTEVVLPEAATAD